MIKKFIIGLVLFFVFIGNCFAIDINSDSLYAMDIDSGRVFYEKNADDGRLIASTTKIMTAIVAIENGNLEDIYEAGDEVLTIYGSNIYLEYHEHMMLLDLLYGLMLRSGNDAAVVIANNTCGGYDNFIKLMNEKAVSLGMNDTIFYNPHGLDEETENFSTAHDLAILYSYAYKNETFKNIVGTKKYVVSSDKKSYVWNNRNMLLDTYRYADGGKTGYTPRAGRVLVTSSSNGDFSVAIASFNNIYDYDLHEKMYDEIFNKYKRTILLDKDNFYIEKEVNGTLYIDESFYYPLTTDEISKVERKVIFEDINNPKDKDVVGKIYLYLDNSIINTTDIHIKINQENFFTKIINFFKNLF